MILRDLLNILKGSNELSELLHSDEGDSKIYAGTSDYKSSCIIYSFTDLISDGVIKQSSLEVDCYNIDYLTCYNMSSLVQKLLITIGDKQLNDVILEVSLSGGGHLYNKDTNIHMMKSIFSIKEKVRC